MEVPGRVMARIRGWKCRLSGYRVRFSALRCTPVPLTGLNPGIMIGFNKMDQRQRFFIYDRKEMGVLILLGIMVAMFAFTLGVHLGKRALHPTTETPTGAIRPAETIGDKVPESHDIKEQAEGVPAAADETLNSSLHDEVAKTGIHMDTPRQVDLPSTTKAKAAEAPAGPEGEPALATPKAKHKAETLAESIAPPGSTSESLTETSAPIVKPHAVARKYTLQIGSFPTIEEARATSEKMEAAGIKPLIRAVQLKGKGKWYRIYLGTYDTKELADQAGLRYRAKNAIGSYIVTHLTE